MRRFFVLLTVLSLSLAASMATAAEGKGNGKAGKAITLEEACCNLTDLKPGTHKMTFVHPYTCCEVEVCFCLPCGCYCVKCGGFLCTKTLRFQYPGLFNDVVLKFHSGGGVTVKG